MRQRYILSHMGNYLFKRTGRLFARPSFFEGYGRAIDMGATLNEYNQNKTPEEADVAAIRSDWQAVGDDIQVAMNKFSEETP